MQGREPEQQVIDDLRREMRVEALWAIHALEAFVRGDEGMGGVDAIRIGVLQQKVVEKVRVYRMTVNVADEPEQTAWLADQEREAAAIGRRKRRGPRSGRRPQ